MKIKPFIHSNCTKINGIEPLRSIENQYGVTNYFYIIDNSNLETFKKEVFIPNFKNEPTENNFKWMLNRWAVSIVSNSYLLNKWLAKDLYLSLNPENWTKVNVVLDGVKDWKEY